MADIGLNRWTDAGGTAAGAAATEAVARAAPWIILLARAGYATKGVLHIVIGALAALAAIGSGGGTTDSQGALGFIGGSGGGRWLLLAMGVGLVGYACWALLAAAVDAERKGSGGKGVALRLGLAARGLAYAALGIAALRMFVTARLQGGDGTERWTARVLDMPAGGWLVGGMGVAIIAYAVYQWWRAARHDLGKRMHLRAVGGERRGWIIRLARFGIAARGVVFLIIGWFLIQAALRRNAEEAGGIDESLATLAVQPYGPAILAVVALGLIAYGAWQLVRARYRDMELVQPQRR